MDTAKTAKATPETYRDAKQPLEARVEDLAGRLTLEEMVALMAGSASFTMMGVERLGIPPVRVTDGPTGVRSNEGEAATVFPVGIAQAAAWNPDLSREIGAAIGREALALNNFVVLAPTINIIRTPLWGRNFETYSEDPFLAGVLGTAFIDGLQSEGVGASLKHYAVNNQEEGRMSVNAEVDERTLREIYLAGFEMAVKKAKPWTVMASYNRINGDYATENPRLLTDILKGEWGYDGVVVSDWGAVYSTAPSARAGCDLEMPGPARAWGAKLLAAVAAGEVPRWRIEDGARRLLRLVLRTGVMDGRNAPRGELRTKRHQSIAARAAEECLTLLKNEGEVLPLDAATLKSVAVIGPNAAVRRIQGGGSSQVRAARQVSILQAIEAHLAGRVAVAHGDGGDNEPFPPAARPALFSPDEARSQAGLNCAYYAQRNFAAEPSRSGPERQLSKLVSTLSMAGMGEGLGALRWTGWFWPEKDGRHELSIRAPGPARLILDGAILIDESTPGVIDTMDVGATSATRKIAVVDLAAGRGYPIVMEYIRPADTSTVRWEFVQLGLRQPHGSIAEAAKIAAQADAAIVVIGAASVSEAEGYDRTDLVLPGDQNALVEAVLAANPRTVVVLVNGAPYEMPWADHAPAILEAWLGGEEGPAAVARVLFGEAEPSGRLPVSFPRRLADSAGHPHYAGGPTVAYKEGLFVGYRHFDRAAEAPLFPFGFGLTYTRFAYADLEAPDRVRAGGAVAVRFALTNVGERRGSEVAQLYVRPRGPSLERPVKELKGFAKVDLAPGERRSVTLDLDARAFSYYDPAKKAWVAEPGAYDLLVGASAADIELQTTIRLDP